MQGHILIVEDEEAIATFLQVALEREGFGTQWVDSGSSARAAIGTSRPDLILLDLMLPGMDGLQVCQTVRQAEQYIPIIMLTARSEEVDKIVGLEIGADDYVTKPFNARELVARVRATLRPARQSSGKWAEILCSQCRLCQEPAKPKILGERTNERQTSRAGYDSECRICANLAGIAQPTLPFGSGPDIWQRNRQARRCHCRRHLFWCRYHYYWQGQWN